MDAPWIHMPQQCCRFRIGAVRLGVLLEELPERVRLLRFWDIRAMTATHQLGRKCNPGESRRLHDELARSVVTCRRAS